MADCQVSSSYDALVQRPSSEDVELTSIISHDSRIHNDNNFDLSDQHESTVSSAEALHQAPDSGVAELTRQRLLQQIEDAQFSSVPTDLEHRSAMQRIGMYGIIVLAATTILMLAVFSFLTFLWTAPHENSFWRLIKVKGWAGGAVTVSSLLLRTAVDLQAGIAVAMLAAIVLETAHLLLADTAQVSRLRAGQAVPIDIVVPYTKAIRYG